jgi:hypothetical protein
MGKLNIYETYPRILTSPLEASPRTIRTAKITFEASKIILPFTSVPNLLRLLITHKKRLAVHYIPL